MVKVQQKIAGTFGSEAGLPLFVASTAIFPPGESEVIPCLLRWLPSLRASHYISPGNLNSYGENTKTQ